MINQAKWIWKKDYCLNDYVIVGNDFLIEEDVICSFIQISAHNHFKIKINGNYINGYVSPAPTVANKVKYYLEYNLTEYLIKGINHIEITGMYLGGSGQNYVNAFPGIIAKIQINYRHSKQTILTDESWYYYETIPYKSNMPFQQNRRITPIEYYDSRIDIRNSKKIKVSYSKMNELKPRLEYQTINEGVVHEEIYPKCIYSIANISVFDVGRIVSGFVSFTLKGYLNSSLIIRYSEDLQGNRVKHNVANEITDDYYDIYIMNEKKIQTHQHDFTYKAFRYVEIEGYPDLINRNDICVLHAGTNIGYEGYLKSVQCGWINRLNEAVRNTQLNNILGQIVDCPHREQAQYLGDSFLQAQVLTLNAKHSIRLIKKTLNDFSKMLHLDGTLPFVAPTNEMHKDFQLKIPEYNLYYILLLNQLWEVNKKDYDLEYYYTISIRIVEYFINKIDSTGLAIKKEDWHIDDWPYPSTDNEGEYLTFENMLLYSTLNLLNKYAKALNIEFPFLKEMDNLYASIRTLLLKNGLFVDCSESKKNHPGINAFALNYGFFRQEEKEKVIDYLVCNNEDSSVILTFQVLKALFENNKMEAAIKRIMSPSRGWFSMIKKGKTLWEGFTDIESHSHAWTGYPLALMQKYIFGIEVDHDESNKVIIQPKIISIIKDLKTKVWTKFGWIEFGYVVKNKCIEFSYKLPKGISSKLILEGKELILHADGVIKHETKEKLFI